VGLVGLAVAPSHPLVQGGLLLHKGVQQVRLLADGWAL